VAVEKAGSSHVGRGRELGFCWVLSGLVCRCIRRLRPSHSDHRHASISVADMERALEMADHRLALRVRRAYHLDNVESVDQPAAIF